MRIVVRLQNTAWTVSLSNNVLDSLSLIMCWTVPAVLGASLCVCAPLLVSESASCGFGLLVAVAICGGGVLVGEDGSLLQAQVSGLDWQCYRQENTADVDTEVPGPGDRGERR